MSVEPTMQDKVFAEIDQEELVKLAISLCDFTSLTGCEQGIAQFMLDWLDRNGLDTLKQTVDCDRFNAIGILKGIGNGPSLTYNGHLDIKLESHLPPIKAYASDGLVYGTEMANQRAALASFMIGAQAIKKSGIQLKGDLVLTGVIGEISTASIGQYQESQDRGEGLGTRHLLANGVQTDYAIVTDQSGYAIVTAQAGVAYFRITTKGVSRYTPVIKRADYENDNAILKMTKVIEIIENWARDYEQKNIYRFSGGQVEPKVAITMIQAGLPQTMADGWRMPFKPSQTPPNCELYVDVRIPPNLTPLKIKHELKGILDTLPFEYELKMFRSQRGYEGRGEEVEYLSSVVERNYETVFQAKPPAPTPAENSVWTDTNLYWEIGITAVKWGPSDLAKYPSRRVAVIDGLVKAAKVYSLTALEICGVARK